MGDANGAQIYTELFASEAHISFQTSCRNETYQKPSFTCGLPEQRFDLNCNTAWANMQHVEIVLWLCVNKSL